MWDTMVVLCGTPWQRCVGHHGEESVGHPVMWDTMVELVNKYQIYLQLCSGSDEMYLINTKNINSPQDT